MSPLILGLILKRGGAERVRFLSLLGALPLTLALLVFALVNRDEVRLSFWPFDATLMAPLSLTLLIVLLVGVFLGGVLGWASSLRARWEVARLRRVVEALQHANNASPLPSTQLSPRQFWLGFRS